MHLTLTFFSFLNRDKHFDEFSKHLKGLVNLYKLPGDKCGFSFFFSLSFSFCYYLDLFMYFSHFVPQQIEDKDVLSTPVSRVRPHQDDAYVQVHNFFSAKKKIFPQYYVVAKKYYFGCYYCNFILWCYCIIYSGGPLSALTCCVNVRLLSAIKKISPLIYSQSWVGSWVYTTQAMMTFTLIF